MRANSFTECIKLLLGYADQAKDAGDYSIANNIFKFLLHLDMQGLCWQLETNDPHGESEFEEYYDLAVVRLGDEYLNIPVPLLHHNEVDKFLSMSPDIVQRLEHTRHVSEDNVAPSSEKAASLMRSIDPEWETDMVRRELKENFYPDDVLSLLFTLASLRSGLASEVNMSVTSAYDPRYTLIVTGDNVYVDYSPDEEDKYDVTAWKARTNPLEDKS